MYALIDAAIKGKTDLLIMNLMAVSQGVLRIIFARIGGNEKLEEKPL